MATTRKEICDEKENTLTTKQATTAAQVLEQLLANPPTIQSKKIKNNNSIIFGSSGYNYHSGFTSTVESYEQASNDIIRAKAAMKLGLVLSPFSRPDALFYIKPEDYPKQLAETERLKNENEVIKSNQWRCAIL